MVDASPKDPWARYEAWRKTPGFSRSANVRVMLPGFAYGTAIFLVASAVETLSKH